MRSKSRENAPKSVPPDDVQPCHDPKSSPSTVPSVGMLRRVRLRAILSGYPTEIFEKISVERTGRNLTRCSTPTLGTDVGDL